jgi:hypothetical protein
MSRSVHHHPRGASAVSAPWPLLVALLLLVGACSGPSPRTSREGVARSPDGAITNRSVDPRSALIQAEASRMAQGFVKGDLEAVANGTHPALLELMGGREGFLRFLRTGLAQMRAQGSGFLSVEIGTPGPVLRASGELFVLVPETQVLERGAERFRLRSHLVGHSTDDGRSWRFVDTGGQAYDRDKLLRVLPRLPAELSIPRAPPPEKLP